MTVGGPGGTGWQVVAPVVKLHTRLLASALPNISRARGGDRGGIESAQRERA